MRFRLVTAALFALVAHPAFSQSKLPYKYTSELTPLLEKDALSIMVSGTTFQVAQTLCQRLGGDISRNLDAALISWNERNRKYIQGAAKALNELAELYKFDGGESAKQEYLQFLLHTSANAATQRLTKQLGGRNVENGAPPPEALCSGLTKWLGDGVADMEREPEKIKALNLYLAARPE